MLAAGLSACASFSPFGAGLDDRIEDHVAVLASDAFEGRDTGEPGFDKAAEYVATFYRSAGLEPAAPDYRQPVPLVRIAPETISGALELSSRGGRLNLEEGETVAYYPPSDGMGRMMAEGSGDIVFVGDGIVAPSLGLDAYRGVDVRGKIVMMFSGAPEIDDNPSSVHLRRFDVKRMEAAKRGAVGILYLDADDNAVSRYTSFMERGGEGQMTIGAGFDTPMPTALLGLEPARKLMADAGRDLDEVIEAVSEGKAESFGLPASAALSTTAEARPVKAYNVVGVVPGTNPALAGEAVIVTAHLDHVGMRPDDDPETDDIYNGALDNASGTAIIMEAARMLAKRGGAERSVIFAALTGEERGLLGSAHLARNVEALGYTPVANVNIDMPVLVYPLNDIIAFGAEYSTLGAQFNAAAAEEDLVATPDPLPELSLFVRSDHYRFVQEGIPSLFLFNGMAGEGKANFEAFMATHYHKPSDEIDLPINWADAATFARLTEDLVSRIANAPERPRWNDGVVFAKDEPRG